MTSVLTPPTSAAPFGSKAPHVRQVNAAEGEPAETNLWSSILNSVRSTRSTPTKNIVVLGEL